MREGTDPASARKEVSGITVGMAVVPELRPPTLWPSSSPHPGPPSATHSSPVAREGPARWEATPYILAALYDSMYNKSLVAKGVAVIGSPDLSRSDLKNVIETQDSADRDMPPSAARPCAPARRNGPRRRE